MTPTWVKDVNDALRKLRGLIRGIDERVELHAQQLQAFNHRLDTVERAVGQGQRLADQARELTAERGADERPAPLTDEQVEAALAAPVEDVADANRPNPLID